MRKILLSLAPLALVIAACGGSGAVAATVNGAEITVGDIEGLLHNETGTITNEQFAQFLDAEIKRVVMIDGARDEYGIEVSDDDVQAEAQAIYEGQRTGEETMEEFVNARGVTEQALLNFAEQSILRDRLLDHLGAEVPDPSQEQIDQEMQTARLQLTTVCASHILLETEEAAQEVLDLLSGGADFAEVAMERSTGPSGPNGGELGCVSPGEYVPEFRDATLVAPVGEVYDTVVQSFFGFHVILVTDRTEPSEADLPSQEEVVDVMIRRAATALLDTWFFGLLQVADVSVDERYGTWTTDPQPQVIPPEA